jgi:hypothetical protein
MLCAANQTPGGSLPLSVILGAGAPLAVTVKLKATPEVAV